MKILNSHGQSLIEVLIALGLASILLPALLTGLVASREGKAQENQRLQATGLLRDAEEVVRSVREKGFSNIATPNTYHPAGSINYDLTICQDYTSNTCATRLAQLLNVPANSAGQLEANFSYTPRAIVEVWMTKNPSTGCSGLGCFQPAVLSNMTLTGLTAGNNYTITICDFQSNNCSTKYANFTDNADSSGQLQATFDYSPQAIVEVWVFNNTVNFFQNATISKLTVSKLDTGSSWSLQTGAETIQGFARQITIADVNRDSNCNIVTSGGTLDPDTKKITTSVSWTGPPSGNVTSTTYLTNPVAKPKRGMIVYGNGGTASDAISYRTLNPCDGTWSAAASTADIHPSTNRALRAARLYSSPTRNEKILITRHVAGSNQFIYAQVFNGTSWGNVQLLFGPWTSNQFLDVQNFDGTYLNNGNFMVVYSDNSIIPRMRIWDGSISTWGGQTSLTTLGSANIPNFIVAKARPQTNEVMAAFFTQGSDTITQYYNGSAWSAITSHATNAPTNTKRFVDFDWSPTTPTQGSLIYADSTADTTLTLKIWTANGTGGGSWNPTVANSAASVGRLGAMSQDAKSGANEYLACQKDANDDIYCFRATNTPAFSTPLNNVLTRTSQNGIQRSFDLSYESISGALGLAVYSDNSTTPKYRTYNVGGNSFSSQQSFAAPGAGILYTVQLYPNPYTDDIMVLMGDANNDLRSNVWNGASDAFYSSGSLALTLHGLTGSAASEFWYDFAWDKY